MSSPLHPARAGAAFDAFLRDAAPASRGQRRWAPSDGPMPALYLGHGAPPLFDDPLWISQLFGWSQALPKPKAILIVSAHWESAPVSLSASAPATPLVYDFGGFAARYFQMTYAHARRHRAGRAGRRRDARHASRCTSTPAAGSTTAPGSR